MSPRCTSLLLALAALLLAPLLASAQLRAHESYEPADPAAATQPSALAAAWSAVAPGLHVALGSVDTRYSRSLPPAIADTAPAPVTAWRGERVSRQFVTWSRATIEQLCVTPGPLRTEAGDTIPATAIHALFIRYVLAGRERDARLVADVLDDADRLDLPVDSVRPVWLSIYVPADAKPGVYKGLVTFRASNAVEQSLPLSIEVLPALLPPPAEWKIHLDLWQNPWAIARYHRVPPWSPEHLALLERHLRLLAAAGEKCITTTIVDQPWGTQTTYDPFGSMVRWTKKTDGSWSFDFADLDRYVALAQKCGIPGPINCYSMVTWSNRYTYFDESSRSDVTITATPGTKEYEAHWRPFLEAFVAHQKGRRLLKATQIAMDERGPDQMTPLLAFVHTAAPGLRVALAGYNHPTVGAQIDDWSVLLWRQDNAEKRYLDPAQIAERTKSQSLRTTFYVCTQPKKPNTFTDSPPAEAEWLGWFAAAQGYDGILRWAAHSWTADPLADTTWTKWPPGDCFLIYPGPRTSIRFERFRDGVEAFEKIRMTRAALAARPGADAAAALRHLDAALKTLTFEAVQTADAAAMLRPCRDALDDAARLMR